MAQKRKKEVSAEHLIGGCLIHLDNQIDEWSAVALCRGVQSSSTV
jgi:hypothetical protein